MQHAVYVVFSSTPYRIGRMIRVLTGGSYNHVSIALDEDLTQMYGFARRYYRTPLYGGFVRESLSRYHVNGIPSMCKICRIPITTEQFYSLKKYMDDMYAQKEQYLYNYLSVLTTPLRCRVQVRNAYLCVEFTAEILSQLDTPVEKNRFYSVNDLEKLLEAFVIREGTMPQPDAYDAEFYDPDPVAHPYLISFRDMFALLTRLQKQPN